MRRLLLALLLLLPLPALADGASLLDTWQAEHKWVRVGLRFYGFNPKVESSQALKFGAGLSLPVTTDFFLGLGMRVAFTASYNRGTGCISRGADAGGPVCDSGEGQRGGVDLRYRQPEGDVGAQQPGDRFVTVRRDAHVAMFGLVIGGNYELTIPTVQVFRIWQPFIGGGLLLGWVYTWPDLLTDDFALIDNADNDAGSSSNVDPWSSQGPEVGGDLAFGFHVNLGKTFRLTLEGGYQQVAIPAAELKKATAGYDAEHLDYRLALFRVGGGFEFRF